MTDLEKYEKFSDELRYYEGEIDKAREIGDQDLLNDACLAYDEIYVRWDYYRKRL